MKSPDKNNARDQSKAGGAAAIRLIHETLRGPVIDIFLENVPAFKGLNKEKAFDLIVSNHALAEECFRLFRHRPDLFAKLLVGPTGKPVTDESLPLYCGRNMNQVIALVVRAVAKRHFLARFPPEKVAAPLTPAETASLWRRMRHLIKKPPPPVPARVRRKATRGDSLFRALGNHLLYEWQLPLLPHYVPLPVSLVRKLGARILEFREPQQLKTLLLEGPPPDPVEAPEGVSFGPEGHVPKFAQKAATLSEKAEAMWQIAQVLDLAKIFNVDERELRRTIAHASAVGAPVLSALGSSGVKMRDSVIVLSTITRSIGHTRMGQFFGQDVNPKLVAHFSEQLREEGIAALNNAYNVRDRTERIVDVLKRRGHFDPPTK